MDAAIRAASTTAGVEQLGNRPERGDTRRFGAGAQVIDRLHDGAHVDRPRLRKRPKVNLSHPACTDHGQAQPLSCHADTIPRCRQRVRIVGRWAGTG